MDVSQKISTMDDAGLANLRANAERLGKSGTPGQIEEAARLMPLIAEEAALRERRKATRVKEAAAERRAKRRSAP